jgi:hypothetical protein
MNDLFESIQLRLPWLRVWPAINSAAHLNKEVQCPAMAEDSEKLAIPSGMRVLPTSRSDSMFKLQYFTWGATRVPEVEPFHLRMTAKEGACKFADASIIPVHFEDCAHFSEGRKEIARVFCGGKVTSPSAMARTRLQGADYSSISYRERRCNPNKYPPGQLDIPTILQIDKCCSTALIMKSATSARETLKPNQGR